MSEFPEWRMWAPGMAGASDLIGHMTAWTVGIDTLVRASTVAVAAADETELQDRTARAMTGPFADWAVVDLFDNAPERSVATVRDASPDLVDSVRALSPETCPVISAAIERGAPVVHAAIEDELLLGAFPGGSPVATVLDARSVAVGPIAGFPGPCGAITIVRCSDRPYLGFRELGILSQIAELTATATVRLRSR